jgi:hypothetical protein
MEVFEGPFETHPLRVFFGLEGHDRGGFVAPVSYKPFGLWRIRGLDI